MFIKNIELTNFRNHESLEIDDLQKVNILSGKNAVGKTSITEAINIITNGKSFRDNEMKNVINFNNDATHVKVFAHNGKRDVRIDFNCSHDKTQFFIDGTEVTRKQIKSKFNTFVFEPSVLATLIKDKRQRLKLIDSQLKKSIPISDVAFKNITKLESEKFNILKQNNPNKELIKVINNGLSKHYENIISNRLSFLENINLLFNKVLSVFDIKFEVSKIKYANKYKFKDANFIESDLNNEIDLDIKSRRITTSPLKDDIEILLDNINVLNFGSQGQKRMSIISLLIALALNYEENTGIEPTFILDDVFSELDHKNKQALISIIHNSKQSFITTTNNVNLADLQHAKTICIGG